jgi:hypothetical protein
MFCISDVFLWNAAILRQSNCILVAIFHPSLVFLPGLLESFIYLTVMIHDFPTALLLKIRIFCVKLCRWVSSLGGIYVKEAVSAAPTI